MNDDPSGREDDEAAPAGSGERRADPRAEAGEGRDEPDPLGVEEAGEDEPADSLVPARAGPRRPRPPATVWIVVFGLAACGVVYAVNGAVNLEARSAVVEVCLAEDSRLEAAIAERSELHLPVSDWMVDLYRARRRYVTELCGRTLDELVWWRWNLRRPIEVDISRASAQEITRVIEEAAGTCEVEVRGLEADLERHLAERGSDPRLEQRVREVTAGQLSACNELGRAVASSRPGFWPPLAAESASATPAALGELMPASRQAPARPGAEEER